MIFQRDIGRLTGLDQPRVSRAAAAVSVRPALPARGPVPGRYQVGDAAVILSYCRLRAAGVGEDEARAAVQLVDEDTWRELAWRDRPLFLAVADGKPAVLGDAARVVDFIGEAPSARTVNLQQCLADVLKVAVSRVEKSA